LDLILLCFDVLAGSSPAQSSLQAGHERKAIHKRDNLKDKQEEEEG